MQTITITFTKSSIVTSIESLLWKYGASIETTENFKHVYNTQASSATNNVDAKVLSDSFRERTHEAIDIIRDFMDGAISYDPVTGDPTVTLKMSDRWLGRQRTLKNALDNYVEDGMLFDWLSVTAPQEAAVYGNKLAADEKEIVANINSLGKPTI